MPKAKPTPPSATEIEDDLAASLRILGLNVNLARDHNEAVLVAYTELCTELRRPPTQVEVAKRAGIAQSAVSHVSAELEREGRLLRIDPAGRKACYIPNMVKA